MISRLNTQAAVMLCAALFPLHPIESCCMGQVAEWIEKCRSEAAELPVPPDVVIRWRRDEYDAAWRKAQEEGMNPRQEVEPISTFKEVRWRGPGKWRYGTTYGPNDASIEYLDRAITDDVA